MKQLIGLLLLFIISTNAYSEFSLAAGQDFHKDIGKGYGEIRWRGTLSNNGLFGTGWGDRFGYSLYAGESNTYGIDAFQTWGRFTFGFGIEAADSDVHVVDSDGGYELLFEWAFTEHWAASMKHRSNCRQICRNVPGLQVLPKGHDDRSNTGYNFLMVRYSF